MEKENIALIGFRATGKSLIGEMLAERLLWSFVDMDNHLTASYGRGIDEWVASDGWKSFREAESRLLSELAVKKNLVVATGGGVILDEANRRRLKDRFIVVWFKASPETILSRLRQDHKTVFQRPPLTTMSQEEEVTQILKERFSLYQEVADLTLDTDDSSSSQLVTAILAFLRTRPEITYCQSA
jgi:shikimate kinase